MKNSVAYLNLHDIPLQLATVRVQRGLRASGRPPATARPTAPASPGCCWWNTASALQADHTRPVAAPAAHLTGAHTFHA